MAVEPIGYAGPESGFQRGRRRVAARPNRENLQQGVGVLPLGAAEIGIPVEAEQSRDLRAVESLDPLRAPAQRGGGVGKRAEGVAEIELAIAEGALAIFPRFTPVDRGQPDPQARPDLRTGSIVASPLFERVVAGQIMIEPVVEPFESLGQDIGFGGMKVAARRVAAQRPAIRTELLPGGEAHREMQQGADGFERQGGGR